jgi:hypothetical protein
VEIKEATRKFGESTSRFGILVGPTGSGKTSFVQAGLIPELKTSGIEICYFRNYTNFKQYLDGLSATVLGIRSKPDDETDISIHKARTILITDQFETFFQDCRDPETRKALYERVKRTLSYSSRIAFIFVIQDDYFQKMTEFEGYVEEPLASKNRYTLSYLSRSRATEIIQLLIPGLNQEYCERIANDLAEDNQVRPPEIQLVLSSVMRYGLRDVNQYIAFGHKDQIIHNFLSDVVEKTSLPLISRKVLLCFIDRNGSQEQSVEILIERCKEKHSIIYGVLCELMYSRIITRSEHNGKELYRLAHEYFRERIEKFLGIINDKTYRSNRLLQHFIERYKVEPKTRIPTFELIRILLNSAISSDLQVRELIKKSIYSLSIRFSLGIVTLAAIIIIVAYSLAPVMWVEKVEIPNAHAATLSDVVFAGRKREIISAGWDRVVRVWDIGRDTSKPIKEIQGFASVILNISYNERKNLLVCSLFRDIVIVDLFRTTIRDLVKEIGPARVMISPDGEFVAYGNTRGRVGLIDINTSTEPLILQKAGEQINAIAVSKDGRLVRVADKTGIRVWDRKEKFREWSVPGDYLDFVFSPEHDFLLAAGGDDIVYYLPFRENVKPVELTRHSSRLSRINLSPSGEYLASGSWGGNVRIFDLLRKKVVMDFTIGAKIISALEFSADGRWLVASGTDKGIIVLERKRATVMWDWIDSMYTQKRHPQPTMPSADGRPNRSP